MATFSQSSRSHDSLGLGVKSGANLRVVIELEFDSFSLDFQQILSRSIQSSWVGWGHLD